MDFTMISILTTVGGILMYLVISALVRTPGAFLQKKFQSLGDMSGKTYNEIRRVVGPESSVSRTTAGDGSLVTIRQWISTGYHIVLMFDANDIFIGISSETSV